MKPAIRRAIGAVAFAIIFTLYFFLYPIIRGQAIDAASAGICLLATLVVGYLAWPAFETVWERR